MTEITNAIIEFVQNIFHNDILTIIFISIVPIIELRGAIPVAFKLSMPWYSALFFSWLGSSLVAPVLLLLLRPILNAMKRTRVFKSLAHAVEDRFQGKADKINEKTTGHSDKKALMKKMLGVYAFVAVPLPLTGVWTGSAVGAFLGLSFWQALPMVLLGNLTAGIIMTVLTVCFKQYVDIILAVFFILVLVVLGLYIVMTIVKMVKNKKKDTVDSVENDAKDMVKADVDITSSTDEVVDDKEVNSIVDIESGDEVSEEISDPPDEDGESKE